MGQKAAFPRGLHVQGVPEKVRQKVMQRAASLPREAGADPERETGPWRKPDPADPG